MSREMIAINDVHEQYSMCVLTYAVNAAEICDIDVHLQLVAKALHPACVSA